MNDQSSINTLYINRLGIYMEDPIKSLRSGLGGEPLNST